MHIRPDHFRMETLRSILPLLRPGDWTASIDLKDAYHHVPIAPASRDLLGFTVAGGTYRFKVLPFGLRPAPRLFTRLVACVAAFLRQRGLRLFGYLDDWLLAAESRDVLSRQLHFLLQTVQAVGFLVNWKKSELAPTRRPTFLHGCRLAPPPPAAGPSQGMAPISGVPGQPSRCAPGLPAAHASPADTSAQALQPIQGLTHAASAYPPDYTTAPCAMVAEGFPQFGEPPTGGPVFHYSNHRCLPAGMGWPLPGQCGFWRLATCGHTLPHQCAGVLSCPSVTPFLSTPASPAHSSHSYRQCDCSGVHKQAGGHALHQTECPSGSSVEVVQTGGNFFPIASYIPGQDNLIADFLSRGRVLPSEWTLHPMVMDQIIRTIGPLQVDLFASALNARLPKYCSRVQDPAAWRIDAFSFQWKGFRGYAFPPISLIPRILRKIREDQARVVLIAPWWPRRNWFPELVGLLAGPQRTLPRRLDLIAQPISQTLHPRLSALHLTAWP